LFSVLKMFPDVCVKVCWIFIVCVFPCVCVFISLSLSLSLSLSVCVCVCVSVCVCVCVYLSAHEESRKVFFFLVKQF
jgi:hypothetical protein